MTFKSTVASGMSCLFPPSPLLLLHIPYSLPPYLVKSVVFCLWRLWPCGATSHTHTHVVAPKPHWALWLVSASPLTAGPSPYFCVQLVAFLLVCLLYCNNSSLSHTHTLPHIHTEIRGFMWQGDVCGRSHIPRGKRGDRNRTDMEFK